MDKENAHPTEEVNSTPSSVVLGATILSHAGNPSVGSTGISFSCYASDDEVDLVSMYFDFDKYTSTLDDMGFGDCETNVEGAFGSHFQGGGSAELFADGSQNNRPRNQVASESLGDYLGVLGSNLDGLSTPGGRKYRAAVRLVEATLEDPEKARRMISNRQSAARSRERASYLRDLEQDAENLRKFATVLLNQLTASNQANYVLTCENNELKVHKQRLEQQIKMQYALNKSLEEELQKQKLVIGQYIMQGSSLLPELESYSLDSQQILPRLQRSPHLLTTNIVTSLGQIVDDSDGNSNSKETLSSEQPPLKSKAIEKRCLQEFRPEKHYLKTDATCLSILLKLSEGDNPAVTTDITELDLHHLAMKRHAKLQIEPCRQLDQEKLKLAIPSAGETTNVQSSSSSRDQQVSGDDQATKSSDVVELLRQMHILCQGKLTCYSGHGLLRPWFPEVECEREHLELCGCF